MKTIAEIGAGITGVMAACALTKRGLATPPGWTWAAVSAAMIGALMQRSLDFPMH